ncbi:hypothetical protein QFZ65_001172 [Arthrobacter sp. B3I9]|nr:hypothetical protein [Arthrobacter sp. B3I9]
MFLASGPGLGMSGVPTFGWACPALLPFAEGHAPRLHRPMGIVGLCPFLGTRTEHVPRTGQLGLDMPLAPGPGLGMSLSPGHLDWTCPSHLALDWACPSHLGTWIGHAPRFRAAGARHVPLTWALGLDMPLAPGPGLGMSLAPGPGLGMSLSPGHLDWTCPSHLGTWIGHAPRTWPWTGHAPRTWALGLDMPLASGPLEPEAAALFR